MSETFNETFNNYEVTFADGSEDVFLALNDTEAMQIARSYDVVDRSSWEYRTIHLIPESVYRMDDWGQFSIRVY